MEKCTRYSLIWKWNGLKKAGKTRSPVGIFRPEFKNITKSNTGKFFTTRRHLLNTDSSITQNTQDCYIMRMKKRLHLFIHSDSNGQSELSNTISNSISETGFASVGAILWQAPDARICVIACLYNQKFQYTLPEMSRNLPISHPKQS